MKINGVNQVQGINKYRQMEQMEREIKQKATKKDEISISNEAKVLLENTKEPVSKETINQLKQQINDGTYNVDAKQIADKMLEWFNK